jgi:Ca-activated chloride channel family protein
LISDGGASTQEVDRDVIAQHANDADNRGIYLVGVGTGPADGYNDALMDYVTDAGRGAYVYLDSEEEATRMFGSRFDEVIDVAARSVTLELDLPVFFRVSGFYGEGYSEDPSNIDAQHLAPGDSMAIYETLAASCSLGDAELSNEVTLRASWRDGIDGSPRDVTLSSPLEKLLTSSPALEKAEAIVAYAEALKSVDQKRLNVAYKTIEAAKLSNPGDADLAEISALVQKHPAY